MKTINLKITDVLIEELIPAEYNPRGLTSKEAEELDKSLDRFGLLEPLIVNSAENRKNIIIGGHQRYYLLKQKGYKLLPVVYVNISDIEKERELNLRLNKNLGHWDYAKLMNFNEEMLIDVGFDMKEIEQLMNDFAPTDEDSQGDLDKLDDKDPVICPNCGFEIK